MFEIGASRDEGDAGAGVDVGAAGGPSAAAGGPVAGAGVGAGAAGAALAEPIEQVLGGLTPSPEAAQILGAVEAADLDGFAGVELVAAWWRLASWAQGQAALAAAVLAETLAPHLPALALRVGSASRAARRVTGSDAVAAIEVALRLGMSRAAGAALVATGRAMSGPLGPVGDALLAGDLDYGKAQEFVGALSGAALPVAVDVQEAVLPGASVRTRSQVARDIAAALIAVDPADAAARHRRAKTCRRVCRPRVLSDGMAGIYAVLPAVDAVALDLALDATATAARAGGDARTTDQLRADALATMAHTALDIGALHPLGSHGPVGQGVGDVRRDDDTRRRGRGRTADGTGTDDADRSAVPGMDAATPEPAVPRAVPRRDAAVPELAISGADATIPEPAVRLPRVPTGGFRVGRIGRRPAQIRVTVPLAVLLGNDDPPPGGECTPDAAWPDDRPALAGEPPPTAGTARTSGARDGSVDETTNRASGGLHAQVSVLERYGPVSPDVARALALGGTWTRLVTDPVGGAVRDVGRTRYTPPADLADLVRTRDGTCVRPGCAVSAQACELDHLVPFHLGGPTAAWNLTALCSTDHGMKSTGVYRVTPAPGGCYDFRLPSGHVYRRRPDGTATHLTRPDGASEPSAEADEHRDDGSPP